MNQELAQLALKFLERITLQPAEIDAFTTVYKALSEYKDAWVDKDPEVKETT
jgi:hypothetical protein